MIVCMAGRKTLPHEPPAGIDPSREVWFITVCCQSRISNQLAKAGLWPFLTESIKWRVESDLWWIYVFLAMPDHCHFLASFPPGSGIKKTLADWKRWIAAQRGVKWQTDFFEHRLRADESFDEKYSYIVANPVRAGLVRKSEEWPYIWRPVDALPFTGLDR